MPITHPPTPGNVLWVTAHPRAASLNGRLFLEGVDALSTRYQVATSDLYAQGFNPVLGDGDLGDLAGVPGNLAVQAGESYAAGQLPADVQAEQAKLAAAELLVLQFPLWWYGPPAILKGWFDRVLTDQFAYGDLDPELGVPRRYGDGGLAGRRALVIVTAGEDERSIGPRGISGEVLGILAAAHGRSVSTQHLIEELWEDAPPGAVRWAPSVPSSESCAASSNRTALRALPRQFC